MGKRPKAWNIVSMALFFVVFIVSLLVFFFTHSGDTYTDLAINLIFDAVALVCLVIYFACCAGPLSRMVSALSRVKEEIRSDDGKPAEMWRQYSRITDLFHNRRLDERYEAYVRESGRQQQQSSLPADCRLEDYIDEELLYSTVNKPFCDQMGGIMSGLGILFTFIGLVYGLRGFDASTVDMMQTSTQALMAGITIAFLTSIFGLVYSLLFGVTYKKLMKDSLDALYDFQDTFTECIRPSSEHAAEDAMLRLQQEQNNVLSGFGTAVGNQVSETMLSILQPMADQLQATLSQYVTVAIEDQRAGLEKVVRYFMDSMNASLGGTFAQLKSRTEELSRWEKDMIDSFTAVSAGIGKAAQDLGKAQASAREITDTIATYTQSMEGLTTAQNGVVQDMQRFMEDYRRLHEKEEDCIRSFAAAAEDARRNSSQCLDATQAVSAIADRIQSASRDEAQEISEAGRRVSQAAEDVHIMAESISSDMTAAAARLERSAQDMEDRLSRSVGDSTAVLDESLSRLSGGIQAMTASVGQVSQAMQGLPRTVTAADADVKAITKSIDGELKLLLEAVSDTQQALARFAGELDQRASS